MDADIAKVQSLGLGSYAITHPDGRVEIRTLGPQPQKDPANVARLKYILSLLQSDDPRVPCPLSRKAYGVKTCTLTALSPPVFTLPSNLGCSVASMAYIDTVLGMLGTVLERPKSAV